MVIVYVEYAPFRVWCPMSHFCDFFLNTYIYLTALFFFFLHTSRRHLSNVCMLLMRSIMLPYFDKRKQVMKVVFLINEQNVSVIYIDINATS